MADANLVSTLGPIETAIVVPGANAVIDDGEQLAINAVCAAFAKGGAALQAQAAVKHA